MATKAELEKKIADLEQELRERDKALRILSSKDGMEIRLPMAAMDMPDGDSSHVSHRPGLGERLITIMEPALRRHGAKLHYTSPAKNMDLKDNIHRNYGDTIVVPIVWGEVMAEIIDAAAQFGRECMAQGFGLGSDLLARLTRNEITADEFDASVEREKAIRRQGHKDVANRIKSNNPAQTPEGRSPGGCL